MRFNLTNPFLKSIPFIAFPSLPSFIHLLILCSMLRIALHFP